MSQGRALIRHIDLYQPRHGEAAVWWLGQHSFVVKTLGAVLYFDPFLSPLPGRRIAPLLKPSDVTHATFIFGSHDHADHIDRGVWPALAAASPRALFVVPELLRAMLSLQLKIPAGRFAGIDDGMTVRRGGVRITGVASAHELLQPDPKTGQYPCLGFVVKAGGCTLYHSGDCCLYEGLQTALRRRPLDVAFLPINGRDAQRLASGCLGNMTYQEAADLAGALAPGVTIPAHFDMFDGNREDPKLFAAYMRVKYPGLSVQIPQYGRRLVVRALGMKRAP